MARYVVSRSDGRRIPEDEPCFVIRGQDAFALRAVEAYIELTRDIVSMGVTAELLEHRNRIEHWQAEHPPKLPD